MKCNTFLSDFFCISFTFFLHFFHISFAFLSYFFHISFTFTFQKYFKKTPFEMQKKCFKAMFLKYFKNIACPQGYHHPTTAEKLIRYLYLQPENRLCRTFHKSCKDHFAVLVSIQSWFYSQGLCNVLQSRFSGSGKRYCISISGAVGMMGYKS